MENKKEYTFGENIQEDIEQVILMLETMGAAICLDERIAELYKPTMSNLAKIREYIIEEA